MASGVCPRDDSGGWRPRGSDVVRRHRRTGKARLRKGALPAAGCSPWQQRTLFRRVASAAGQPRRPQPSEQG